VLDVEDPRKLGRVKVNFPWMDPEHSTDWVRIATLYGGPGKGSFFIPDVGDEVLLAFEHGNPRVPFIVGALWNGKDQPPALAVRERRLQSRNGHRIRMLGRLPPAGATLVEHVEGDREQQHQTLDRLLPFDAGNGVACGMVEHSGVLGNRRAGQRVMAGHLRQRRLQGADRGEVQPRIAPLQLAHILEGVVVGMTARQPSVPNLIAVLGPWSLVVGSEPALGSWLSATVASSCSVFAILKGSIIEIYFLLTTYD